MTPRRFPWDVLGIDSTTDTKAIRAAYAAKLKALDVDADIAGYDNLRRARDCALEDARNPPQHDDGDFGLGGGDLDQVVFLAASPPVEEAQARQNEQPVNEKPDHFLALLFPDRAHSDTPLTREEYDEAALLQQGIIAEAGDAAIDEQAGIENWLAHYLATAWPRSGPLVEDAVAAFGWGERAGRIDENPAARFLNDRITALRHMEELEQPTHPWHAAWKDLKQPGPRPKRLLSGPRINDVVDLVAHLHTDYPELLDYVDGQRLASWTKPEEPSKPFKIAGLIAGVFLIFICFIGGIYDLTDIADGQRDRPTLFDQPWNEDDRARLRADLFGRAVTGPELEKRAPILFVSLTRETRIGPGTGPRYDKTLDEMREIVRFQTFQSAGKADFEHLVQIKQYRLSLLRTIRENLGASECFAFAQQQQIPDAFELPDELYTQESKLFGDLLQAGQLGVATADPPENASVNGIIVEKVMQRIGITRDRFSKLAQGEGDDDDRCDFIIAMLEVVLQRPADASIDLLRMI